MERELVDGVVVRSTESSLTIRCASEAQVVVRRSHGRCTVRLGFGRAAVGPDVSVQPGAVVAVIDQQARFAGADPNRWRVACLRALREWEPSLEWCDLDPSGLVAALGALTHPLLAAMYRRGAAPVGDIPRWASPILRAPDPAAAARVLDDRSNRRLTRSLAAGLAGTPGAVDLVPVSLAVAASGQVSVDELANLLEATTAERSREAWPSVDQVRVLRTGLGWFGADRRVRLLVDAADDPARLAELMERLAWVQDRAPRPLPATVRDLAALLDRLVPVLAPPRVVDGDTVPTATAPTPTAPRRRVPATEPPPPPHPAETVGAAPVAARRAPPPRPAGRQPLHPPRAPATAPDRWPVHPELLRIDGHRRGDLTFHVPTSITELRWWSRQLANCLDTFGPAAAHGRSWLVGIRRGDDLIGCVELCPRTRRLRQALGPRNRPLPTSVHDAAIGALADASLVRDRRRT